jgi:hypothetical protein
MSAQAEHEDRIRFSNRLSFLGASSEKTESWAKEESG